MRKTTKRRWGILLAVPALLAAAAWARPSGKGALPSPQEEEDRSTLIGGQYKPRLYFELVPKFARIHDGTAVLMGGGFGVTFNRVFSIGLAGWGNVDFDDWSDDDCGSSWHLWPRGNRLYGYGGIFLGYHFLPARTVFGRISLLLGAGARGYNGDDEDFHWWDWDATPFWLIEPGIDLGVNVMSFLRLTLGLSCPIVSRKMGELERIHVAFGLQLGK